MTDIYRLIAQTQAAYARTIDDDRLEEWPGFFADPCSYVITTADNHREGLEGGIISCYSHGMLRDRISALREANIYERQRYRHIVGLPAVLEIEGRTLRTETSFLVVRVMRDGKMDVFATGRYLDRVEEDAAGALRFRERIVVCDSNRFDTLVAIPF